MASLAISSASNSAPQNFETDLDTVGNDSVSDSSASADSISSASAIAGGIGSAVSDSTGSALNSFESAVSASTVLASIQSALASSSGSTVSSSSGSAAPSSSGSAVPSAAAPASAAGASAPVAQEPLQCTYHQEGHSMTCQNAQGQETQNTNQLYSGKNVPGGVQGKNNPDAQNVSNVGPLPRGDYTVGNPVNGTHMGPDARPLIPDATNNMEGRSGMYMHGDSILHPGEASNGCIIAPPDVRNQTNLPTGTRVHVVR